MSGDDRPQFCPRCGAEAPAHGDFCPECGANMVAEAQGPESVGGQSQTAPSQISDRPDSQPTDGQPDQAESGGITRRNVVHGGLVAAILTTAVGGWFVVIEDDDQDAGPEYGTDISPEELVLPIESFPSGWERDDSYNENFNASYLSGDERVVVLVEVTRYNSVSAAKNSMQSIREGFEDQNEMSFADDAFWAVGADDTAYTAVRDSNVTGGVIAVRQSGLEWVPDTMRSQTYAREMYQHWQTL